MDPFIVDFQGALSTEAKQTANNQSEQRHMIYRLSPSAGVTRAGWGVLGLFLRRTNMAASSQTMSNYS